MKQLTLFLVLVILVVGTTTLFAGVAKDVKPFSPQVSQSYQKPASPARGTDSDIPTGRAPKSSHRQLDMSKAQPVMKLHKYNLPELSGGLAGTFQIPSGPLTDLATAANLLAFFGTAGDVTFELTNSSNTETEPVVFGAGSNDGTYKVTIKGAAGVHPVVHFVSTIDEGKGFVFNGAKNISIEGLAIDYDASAVFPTNDAFASPVFITGGSSYITVKNCNIKSIVDNAVWADQTDGRSDIFIFAQDADGVENSYLTFDADTLTHATFGIKSLMYDGNVVPFTVDHISITNCRLGGAYGDPLAIGSLMEITAHMTFEHNIIDGIIGLQTYWYNGTTEYDAVSFFGWSSFLYDAGQITGSHILATDGSMCRYNIFKNVSYLGSAGDGTLTYGSRFYYYGLGYALGAGFIDNVIDHITNPGGSTSQIVGFRGTANWVYHNSIRLWGTTTATCAVTCINNGGGYIYNNAVSNEMAGTASYRRGITAGGTIDYNGIYSVGYGVSGYSTVNAAVAAGQNAHGVFGAIGFNPADLTITTGPSAAEDIGRTGLGVYVDFNGNPIDTAALGKRDAGAFQFSTGNPIGVDVLPAYFAIPPSGVPKGVPQTPAVVVKNNSATTTDSIDVTVTQTAGPSGTYISTKKIVVGPNTIGTILMDPWTPADSGSYTLSATTTLAGDITAGNNTVTKSTLASPPTPLPASGTTYMWNTDDEGWTRTIDFVRTSAFTKLGGPKDGAAMITNRPTDASTYTEGAYASSQGYSTTYPGPNLIISPWLDISGLTGTDLYVSFYQSTSTENLWDRSWVEYTLDGATWNHLGVLNDPNGVNWYNEALYAGAQIDPDNFDFTTAIQYGLMPNDQVTDFPTWTTNADETTPGGWVYTQLKVTDPAVARAHAIRFRYVAFSDALTTFEGWAVDNFGLTPSAPVFKGGTIEGVVFNDANGNTLNDDASFASNVTVNEYLFGSLIGTMKTDVNGHYSFSNVTLPATYVIEVVPPTGTTFSYPIGCRGTASVGHLADSSTLTQNFGFYIGSVTGHIYSDINLDNAYDAGDKGLAGWSVNIYQDSVNHALITTATTNSSGQYSTLLGPGNYAIQSVNYDPAGGNINYPEDNIRYIAITGNSNSVTSNVIADPFGYYVKGSMWVLATQDNNADGHYQLQDYRPLDAGTDRVNFDVYKNGVLIATDILGDGVPFRLHERLDTAAYRVILTSPTPVPYRRTTTADTIDFVIDKSSVRDSAIYLYFGLGTARGFVREDMNGNGTNDGEPGLLGWTVTIDGDGAATTTTDSTGYYQITGVGPGSHTITLTQEAGYTRTYSPSSQTWNQTSGAITIYSYLNFKRYNLSGVMFRDRNRDGVLQTGEEGLVGWEVSLTGKSNVFTVTGGTFTFTDIGPGALSLTAVMQSGYTSTIPGGALTVTGTSGTDATRNLGAFRTADDQLFRTVALDMFEAAACLGSKPGVVLVAGKTFAAKNVPNMGNFLNAIVSGMKVGNIGVKGSNAWFQPVTYKDIYASLCVKGTKHDLGKVNCLDARGFDWDLKHKPMYSQWKKVQPTKVNNYLFAQLVAFKTNLLLSAAGYLPNGLGGLIYVDATNPTLNGKTLDEIGVYADNLMTNWGGVPYSTYCMLDSVVTKINLAFYDGPTTVIDSAKFHGGAKPWIGGFKSVLSVSFLKWDPAVQPATFDPTTPEPVVPVKYALNQNYPNPFNPSTTISFDLPEASLVTLKIYNVLGQEVATVLDRQAYDGGQQVEVDFDASSLASGMYLYRIVAEQVTENGQVGETFTEVKKMMLMK
jgi:hypothetical protein